MIEKTLKNNYELRIRNYEWKTVSQYLFWQNKPLIIITNYELGITNNISLHNIYFDRKNLFGLNIDTTSPSSKQKQNPSPE